MLQGSAWFEQILLASFSIQKIPPERRYLLQPRMFSFPISLLKSIKFATFLVFLYLQIPGNTLQLSRKSTHNRMKARLEQTLHYWWNNHKRYQYARFLNWPCLHGVLQAIIYHNFNKAILLTFFQNWIEFSSKKISTFYFCVLYYCHYLLRKVVNWLRFDACLQHITC